MSVAKACGFADHPQPAGTQERAFFGQDRSESGLARLVDCNMALLLIWTRWLATDASQINLASNVISALSSLETGQFFSASLVI
jgi:hypothetical protein